MKKRILCIILALCLLCSLLPQTSLPVYAASYSGTCGDSLTWRLDTSTGVLSISGTGKMTDYSSTVNLPWYSQRNRITSVEIGNGVTSIGSESFDDCSNLTQVTIPNSVTSIGSGAFFCCSSLASVTIPNSVTHIYNSAFAYCSSLTSVALSNQITFIADRAFYRCTSLTSMDIPNGVTFIEGYAFADCTSLARVTIPNSVTYISISAFENCSSLASVSIPQSVTVLESDVFSGCSSLTSVTIPNNVTNIYERAFFSCSSLSSVTIPSSVTSIGYRAFSDCSSLADVYYGGNQADWALITIDSYNEALTSAAIHYNSYGLKGEFQFSSSAATNCLKKGTSFGLFVGYYLESGELDPSSKTYRAVVSDANIIEVTPDGWSEEWGQHYTITAKEKGSATLTVTNSTNTDSGTLAFYVVDSDTGYSFDHVPTMTIEEGKTTNFYNYSGMVVDEFAYTPHKDADGNVDYYNVTMTVYNSLDLYGAVTSYTEEGDAYSYYLIDKLPAMPTSFVGTLESLFKATGDLFFLIGNQYYYSGESVAKKTEVSIEVPAGGYLEISNCSFSHTVLFANITSLVVDLLTTLTDFEDDTDTLLQQKSLIVTQVLKEVFDKDYVSQKLLTTVKDLAIDEFGHGKWSYDHYGDRLQALMDRLTEAGINLAEIISEKVVSVTGIASITESIVKGILPTGKLIDWLYDLSGIGDILVSAVTFNKSINYPQGIYLYAPVQGNTYVSSGIRVSLAGSAESGVVIHAYQVVDTAEVQITSTTFPNAQSYIDGKYMTYSIAMYQDGDQTQPSAPVTVKIPLSDEFSLLDPSRIKVYCHNGDSTATDMHAEIADGYAVFTTDHFGYYSVVDIGVPNPNPFVDVANSAYYRDAVLWAVKNRITMGTSETTFSPNASCTRAQAVTFLWRAAGCPAPRAASSSFTDVRASEYYYDAVLWAVENGVTVGTGKTTFSPGATCTRAQIVTFLWRALGSPETGGTSSFQDVNASDYYAAAVRWAVENNVTVGTGETTFSPGDTCTRAQIVTFLYRSFH
ncbi:MAG: leucine-rich repeat protein [Faecousia sp.]